LALDATSAFDASAIDDLAVGAIWRTHTRRDPFVDASLSSKVARVGIIDAVVSRSAHRTTHRPLVRRTRLTKRASARFTEYALGEKLSPGTCTDAPRTTYRVQHSLAGDLDTWTEVPNRDAGSMGCAGAGVDLVVTPTDFAGVGIGTVDRRIEAIYML